MLHTDAPHRRYNPLTGEWILVSPHRTQRPWQGQTEESADETLPEYDPSCYLCPGNGRAGGAVNPKYTGTFVFVNDFSALLPDTASGEVDQEGLFVASNEKGVCKVLCFSPRHDLTLSRMGPESILGVVDTWVSEYTGLGSREEIGYVQIFENRGAMMGCSNPHPHCQIWANETVPLIPEQERRHQEAYLEQHGKPLLTSYLAAELRKRERIVLENDHFVALVPFWAVWPFELMILPRAHRPSIELLDAGERESLARIIGQVGVIYDNLFRTSFPYSMGIHQRPTDGADHPEWQMHLRYLPPLLRSATVRKFMVGYELLAMPQRDITAETSAERLRSQSLVHYRQQGADSR